MNRPRSSAPAGNKGAKAFAPSNKGAKAFAPSDHPSAPLLYAYCLVAQDHAPDLSKLPAGLPATERPRLLALGRERFLVVADASRAAYDEAAIERGLRDLAWVSDCAVAHERVIDHFLTSQALLPMKLFTVFTSDAAALAAMRRGERRTAALLARLAGHVECGVRVRFLAPPADGSTAGEAPAVSGRAFLEAKKTARDARRVALSAAARAATALGEALGKKATETRTLEPPAGAVPSGLLLDAAYLLKRERVGAFEDILQKRGRELQAAGCEIVLTGPWPAYHFMDAAGGASG